MKISVEKEQPFNAQDFYNYLRDKGMNDNGANEIIDSIAKGRPSREATYQLQSFQKDTGAIKNALPETLQQGAQEVMQAFHRATRGR